MFRIITAAALVLATACAHGPVSANRKYAAAPRIENPLLGRASPVPGMTSMPEPFVFSSFDARQICFDDTGSTQSPAEATATQYTLRFLVTDDVDLKNAPSLKGGQVQVLNSSSTLVPVRRTVKDTIRDEHGNTIATVDREVQELETRYQTQLRHSFEPVDLRLLALAVGLRHEYFPALKSQFAPPDADVPPHGWLRHRQLRMLRA